MSLILKKLFVMSAVPAAVALSYSPARHTASASRWDRGTEDTAAQTETVRSADPSRRKPAMTQTALQQELERHGLPSERAQRAVSSASCAGGLASTAHVWLRGERFTGIMLVPDNAQGLCGYGDVPQWVFRSRMMSIGENIACATRIHGSALGPSWFASLDYLTAVAERTPTTADGSARPDRTVCATSLARNTVNTDSTL